MVVFIVGQMLMILLRKISLGLLLFSLVVPSSFSIDKRCLKQILNSAVEKSGNLSAKSERLNTLEKMLQKLDGKSEKGPKVVMAAVELGNIPGLKTASGANLNISAGGVSTVMTDLGVEYPKLLANKNGSSVAVGMLMDGIDVSSLTRKENISVIVDGKSLDIGVYEFNSSNGTKYIFLDNPLFKTFTVIPDKAKNESIYTMRGLENDVEGQQRVWSAFNQGISKIVKQESADIYIPHDSHVAPASFYNYKNEGLSLISSKPLIHNEQYLGTYSAKGDNESARAIALWNVSYEDLNEYFRQGENIVMMAPAVRKAEQNELFAGLSVSDGTANEINSNMAKQQIDFFRVKGLTNGLGEINRPHLSPSVKAGVSKEMLLADGIKNEEVIKEFQEQGFAFGGTNATGESILKTKARAKEALQKNYGMDMDTNRPLFVSFARWVNQKGMTFAIENIENILNKGGQVIIGGPVGDEIGSAEREMILALIEKLKKENNPNLKNLVYIDGMVKGNLKGLTLAGHDFFMLPSRYEPCGLTDVESIYNGGIPIGHNVGGIGKSKSTILYGPTDPNNQGVELGKAINEAFDSYGKTNEERKLFHDKQLAAIKENFSWEKNFDEFTKIQRLETYHHTVKELDNMVLNGKITQDEAKQYIHGNLIERYKNDMPEFTKALEQQPTERKSELVRWVIESSMNH